MSSRIAVRAAAVTPATVPATLAARLVAALRALVGRWLMPGTPTGTDALPRTLGERLRTITGAVVELSASRSIDGLPSRLTTLCASVLAAERVTLDLGDVEPPDDPSVASCHTALRDGAQMLGVLAVQRPLDRPFDDEDAVVLEAVGQLATMAIRMIDVVQEARDSEAAHRLLTNTVREVLFRTDLNGHWTFLNAFWTEVTGFATDECIGRSFLDFIHPAERRRAREEHEALVARDRQHARYETRYVTRDDEVRWMEVNIRRVDERSGMEPAMVGTLVDITSRRRADEVEQRIAETQRFLAQASSALASSLDYETTLQSLARLAIPRLADWCVVDVVDRDRTIRRVAIAAVNSHKEGLLAALRDRFPPQWNTFQPSVLALATGEAQLITEFTPERLESIAADETQRMMLTALGLASAVAVPLKARNRVIGAMTCVSGDPQRRYASEDVELMLEVAGRAALAVDHAWMYREANAEIASRARAEQSLLQHARHMALSAEIGLAIADGGPLDALLRRCVDAIARQLNAGSVSVWLQSGDAEVLEPLAVAGVTPDEESAFARVPAGEFVVGRIARDNAPMRVNDLTRHPEYGNAGWARREGFSAFAGCPLAVKDTVFGVVGMLARDPIDPDSMQALQSAAERIAMAIERDRVERELQHSEEQLRQAQKMEAVGRLAGGVAHDFNNMLTAIRSYSELLLDSLPPPNELREHVEEIRRSSDRAAALTRQLLAFSRKQVLQPRVLDLNSVIVDLEQMLRRLLVADMELVTDLDPALGMVKADPGQIEQILMNLIVNARDAMPAGGRVVIRTSQMTLDASRSPAHDDAPPGRYVMLTVSDTGAGMDEETQQRIFEPFFTTKARGAGTGLGLSTVYGIVQQSGGHIRVSSVVGIGTAFTIYLPLTQEAAPAPTIALLPSSPRADGDGEVILLVDDEDSVRRPVRRILERSGYTVIEASSGQEALAAAVEHREVIDLIITDMMMPGMTGRELVQEIETSLPAVRVLFTSGYTDDEIIRRGMLDERRAFIQKPFALSTLVDKVREVLRTAA